MSFALLHRLKRHPFPVVAHFRQSLVLTYALPRDALTPLLSPGLRLDTFGDFGFVAIAMVQTEGLRPTFLPKVFGQDFFLSGYRIFTRFQTGNSRTLRGLKILRSDTDRRRMVWSGNALTHYHYRFAKVDVARYDHHLEIAITTPRRQADLHVIADLSERAAQLPDGSPFNDWHQARLFAGPLPFTFDFEESTNSIVLIEGVREHWHPRPVAVEVRKATFFDSPPFASTGPILASAFFIEDIPYRWKRGVVEQLPPLRVTTPLRRGRYQGVLQILRFNWPMYASAAVVLGAGAAAVGFVPLPLFIRFATLIGIGAAAFWLLVSLAVSHYVYDLAGIYGGHWLARAVRRPPQHYANLHAGFDEFSHVLAERFPESQRHLLDFFDTKRMTEPSIARAREVTKNQAAAQQVDFRSLPLLDDQLDAAFLIFAAHELREPDARVQLFRELHRSLTRSGSIVLVEHLRDVSNFIAFGPGFFHFHSRGQWLDDFAAARLRPAKEFSLTPFVHVFVLDKT